MEILGVSINHGRARASIINGCIDLVMAQQF